MIPNLDWLDHAACASVDSRAFFASGCHSREQVHAAKRVCAMCPVQDACRDYAITTGERNGVWGGMSQKELRQKRRRFTDRTKTDLRETA